MFRQRLVIYIFRKLDRNSSGFIEESELAKFYKSSNLPEILDGAITPKAKSKEFINNIGTPSVVGGPEGRVSVDQFIDYYLSKSLVFLGTDEVFRAEVLSEWRVENDGTGNSNENLTPILSPPQPDGKHPSPSPPISITPTTSQITSPRIKKATPSVTIEQSFSEPEEYDAQYRQLYPTPTSQTGLSPRRASTDLDTPNQSPRNMMSCLSPSNNQHNQNNNNGNNNQNNMQRFSRTPIQQSQPQPRIPTSSVLSSRDHHSLGSSDGQVQVQGQGQGQGQGSQNNGNGGNGTRSVGLEFPQSFSPGHRLQQQQQQYQQTTQQTHNGSPRSTDQVISDNLNSLMISLQQKVFEQEQTIESQHQVMTTQQQMLSQLQMLLDQQRQQTQLQKHQHQFVYQNLNQSQNQNQSPLKDR